VSMDEQGGNLADETAEMMSESVAHQNEELRKRRSTRIMQAVPLAVTGVDALGRPFTERTSTLIINCHGCRYQSKHYVLKNMWVTLEVPHPESGQPPRSVRGRVAWIQRPRTVRQLFQIALELETPGNTWGIAFPPPDWFAPQEIIRTSSAYEGAHELPARTAEPAEIHLPLMEPEPSAAPAPQDNLRVFPAPASATDASLQLARHMARLMADAKQQIQAASREIASQAVAAERRVSMDEWEQRTSVAKEQLSENITAAIQRIQEESELSSRAANSAAAEALQRDLPVWIAPQLEQLTRDLTQQISDRGTAERSEQAQHLARAVETLAAISKQAEESAARLRAQAEQSQSSVVERAAQAVREVEEVARQREVAAQAHREALSAAVVEIQQQVSAAISIAHDSWQSQLNSETEAAQGRWRSTVETTLGEAQEKAATGLNEQAHSLLSQVQEELARQAAATRESLSAAAAEAEQRAAALNEQVRSHFSQVQEEAARQAAALRESLSAPAVEVEQRVAGVNEQLRSIVSQAVEEAERHGAAIRDSANSAASEAEQRVASLNEQVRSNLSQAQEEAARQAATIRESIGGTAAEAEQRVGGLNEQLRSMLLQVQEEAGRHAAAARESVSAAATQAEQRVTGLHNSLQERSKNLDGALAYAAESSERLEHLSARIETTQGRALAAFETQIDDVLNLHRNELHRRSETQLEEINGRIRTTFDEYCQQALSRFDQQIESMVEPHVSRTEQAIHRLAGGRSLLDAAMTLQQDRIRTSADEAFAESLARFRENLGGVDELLQEAAQTVAARNLTEIEAKAIDLKHQTVDDLMKSAEWYEKKAQTQIQSLTEKTVEQAETQFREKAGEVSSVFASELDHSSRSFIGHTQTQMDEVVRDAFNQARALFAEAAETTTAAFTDEIQRQARQELDGFGEEAQRSLGETRTQLDVARAELAHKVTAEQETFLREFRNRMSGAVEAGVVDAREKVQSGMSPLLDAWKTTVEQHRAQMGEIYAQLSNQASEVHRNRLENVSTQWLLATVASLDHQSREAAAKIAANAEEKLRETCAQVFAGVGETLQQRLQQIAASLTISEPPGSMSRSTTAGGGS